MSLFGSLGKAIGGAASSVVHAGSTVVSTAKNVVTQPVKAVTALPGVALNAALWVPHVAAQATGETLKVVGSVTGSDTVKNIGKSIHAVDSAVIKGAINNPVASAEILGGAILAASGVGAPAAAGLVAKGAAGIAGSAVEAAIPGKAQPGPSAVPNTGAQLAQPPPAPASSTTSTQPLTGASSEGEGFLEWLLNSIRNLFS